MTNVPVSFVHYNAAWNERDPARVRDHLELAVAEGVVFADPDNRTEGIDELDAMIRNARLELPDAKYGLDSEVDGGHDRRYRLHWRVLTGTDAAPIVGTDVITIDAEDRITRVDGFFGHLPRSSGPEHSIA